MKINNRTWIASFIVIAIILILADSCKKDQSKPLPNITTNYVIYVTQHTAITGGNIINDGGVAITIRGVCWSKGTTPTISDSKTTNGGGSGSFISSITGLTSNTIYYVRAYAININGTGYGVVMVFTTPKSELPVLTTSIVTSITDTSATCGGNITFDGGSTITMRGICWDTSQHPIATGSHTSDSLGTGVFTSSITGLKPATTYYLRSFAINSIGTGYGNEITFTTQNKNIRGIMFNPNLTYGSVTDTDGNTYKTIQIGTQTWMAENLKTTRYKNGDLIGTTSPATLDISSETTAKYQWAYNGDESKVAIYGRLYTWYAVTDSRYVCPTGWHVPSDEEWTALTDFLSGADVAGGKLKETGFMHWWSPNTGATNATGFTALPGGYRYSYGEFDLIGYYGFRWSSSESSTGYAWCRKMYYNYGYDYRSYGVAQDNFSVRCLRD